MKVNIKRINPNATIPTKGSCGAAGYDLRAILDNDNDVLVYPHTSEMVGTGLIIEVPDGYFGGIYARSGIAYSRGERPANCVGVVDSDYRGEVKVAVHNDLNYPFVIHNGDKIAQLIIQPCLDAEFNESDIITDTERGDGGFGSTGTS